MFTDRRYVWGGDPYANVPKEIGVKEINLDVAWDKARLLGNHVLRILVYIKGPAL